MYMHDAGQATQSQRSAPGARGETLENLLAAVDAFERWGQKAFPADHPLRTEITDYWWRTRRLVQRLPQSERLLSRDGAACAPSCSAPILRGVGMVDSLMERRRTRDV